MGSSSQSVVRLSDQIGEDAKLGGECAFNLLLHKKINSIKDLSINILNEREFLS